MASRCSRVSASRSVVRQVGDVLPIRTGKRLYIQLPNSSIPSTPDVGARYAATGERLAEEGLKALSNLKNQGSEEFFQMESITEDSLEEASLMEAEEDVFMEDNSAPEGDKQMTMDKISALESELAKLKAQIAVYALTETRDLPPVPAPPPPPPPPALDALSTTTQTSGARNSESESPSEEQVPSTPARPPMADVLRDIGSVKLRTVETVRSPGGTPLRRQNKDTQEPLDNDPASIIATALRKKFANRVFQDSPDKENRSELSMSEFDSPNVKLQFN